MKPGGYIWLSAANTRRGRRNTGIFVLMTIGLTSLILILGTANMLNHYMDNFLNTDYARRISFGPIELEGKSLSEEQKEEIIKTKHVLSLEENNRWGWQLCNILSINGEQALNNKLLPNIKIPGARVISEFITEHEPAIAGKSLAESEDFTCMVPSVFYPDFDVDTLNEDVDFLDGRTFIGTTLSLKSDKFAIPIAQYSDVDVPPTEFTLKVVGVYDIKKTAFEPDDILVSHNTGVLLDKLCMEHVKQENPIGYQAVIDLREDGEHNYYSIVLDDSRNVQQVIQDLDKIGIKDCTPNYIIYDAFKLFVSVVNVAGRAFTFAVLGLAVLNIFLAVHNAMTERTKEIGLLKAIGYKDRQVFLSMYLEQLKIGLKSFCIAAVLSAAAFALYNWFAQNGSYDSMLKTVSWTSAALLAAAALAIAVLVPLLCQLFTLRRLVKIPPSEAMKL